YGPAPVPPEADLYLDWEEREVSFADGDTVSLRKPRLRIENLNFGPLGPQTMLSLRNAQPIFGLGLLDAVPEATILALASEQKTLGFNGHPNYVWDAVNRRTVLGRYGWKANQASLREQIAAAAMGDMGLNSRLFPEQNCPPVQTVCARTLPGNFPEIIDHEIDALEIWLRGLAVPLRRNVDTPQFARGQQLFAAARCAVCHAPELRTAERFPALPQLANQTFRAYTDLLLHDMGEELADGRPDYLAGPRDWRTQPLWGLGLSETLSGSNTLLHDGRARNVTEAILWHGGEAEFSREAFRNMPRPDREALTRFVESI
ncbi:MAG: di-heme oxidoredictase family protein, partial [Burkholderiales bacterium]